MEETLLFYRDAYGISRTVGLSLAELQREGVSVTGDIEFGFMCMSDLELDNASTNKENPAWRLYRALSDAGRTIVHSTYEKTHFYNVLAASDTAG